MKRDIKHIKKIDVELYRRFKGHCIAEGIQMGEAFNGLMLALLKGNVSLSTNENDIVIKTKPGTCHWPRDRRDVT